MRLLLDSTFLIDHLRGDLAATDRWHRIFSDDRPFVNEIVACEVRSGLRPYEEDHLRSLLEPIEFVQPAVETALLAGRWRAELSRQGVTLSVADALIAAAAAAIRAAVLTRNVGDFALTPVSVETY